MKRLKKQTLDGNVETLLLAILEDGPSYGYAIVKELNSRSEGLLEMAREHHKSYSNVNFVKCNGTDLSCFEDNTFDYIYERLVFIHVPKEGIVKYIKEFFRVLRPGGFLYIPDLPKEEACTNGFTMAEMEMFRDFRSVNVSAIGYDNNPGVYMVKCAK